MELVGSSVDQLTNPWRNFSLQQVTTLTYKLLYIIEDVHKHQMLHLDIKPGNICIRDKDGCQTVHLVDFGSSKSYVKPGTDEHLDLAVEQSMFSTPTFASSNAHSGIRCSRRDDLESLFYTMI